MALADSIVEDIWSESTGASHPGKTRPMRPLVLLLLAATVVAGPRPQDPERVDERLITTYQRLDPSGWSVQIPGRPVDIALSQDGSLLWIKDNTGLRVIQVAGWKEVASLSGIGGSSLTGLAVSGETVHYTNASNQVHRFKLAEGKIVQLSSVTIPGPAGKGASFPCGLDLTADGKTTYVCASRNNTLARIDTLTDKLLKEIPVGIAPYDALVFPNEIVVVSNQGGRRPLPGAKTAPSSESETEIDERGIANSGTVSIV